MILVDTSVWIEFFHDIDSQRTELLAAAVRVGTALVGDLILVEVLQGLRTPAQVRIVAEALSALQNVTLCGPDVAPEAAANYRQLRRKGITIRSTIDVIIATWCIRRRVSLLHHDRDFDAIEERLGLLVHR